MNLSRKLGLATTALVAATALSSCGFNYPTDRIYTPAAGVNYRQGTVDVLNAAVVSKQDNAGTFIATFSNNSQSKTVTLNSISGDGSAVGIVNAKPLAIKPNAFVNLATKGGVPVTGTFQPGQLVTMTLTFDNGQSATMDIPVVADAGQWAGLDQSTPSATTNPSGSSSPAPSASTTVETPSASAS